LAKDLIPLYNNRRVVKNGFIKIPHGFGLNACELLSRPYNDLALLVNIRVSH